jgi:hypothetical protein
VFGTLRAQSITVAVDFTLRTAQVTIFIVGDHTVPRLVKYRLKLISLECVFSFNEHKFYCLLLHTVIVGIRRAPIDQWNEFVQVTCTIFISACGNYSVFCRSVCD